MRFPDNLPFPDLAGYRVEFDGDHHRQRFLTGSAIRKRVRYHRDLMTLSWMMNKVQKETLEAFHRQAGGVFFTINLPCHHGTIEQQARFSGPLRIAFNGVSYRVAATLKIHRALSERETDELLAHLAMDATGFVPEMATSLHQYINDELPQVIR